MIRKSIDGSRILQRDSKELKESGLKYCPSCKKILTESAFGRMAKGGGTLAHLCFGCMREYQNELYKVHRQHRTAQRKAFKKELVALLGGKCCRCGYSEFVSGLDFHHIGEDLKGDILSQMLSKHTTGRENVVAEADKCALLCRCCHTALHAQEWDAEWVRRVDGMGYTIKGPNA